MIDLKNTECGMIPRIILIENMPHSISLHSGISSGISVSGFNS